MMDRVEIERWLRAGDAEELYRRADEVRRVEVGDAVHLRGLIEVSNHCVRGCWYCGLRAGNGELERYRMGLDEVVACAREAASYGYGTVVIQAGEDYGLTGEWVEEMVRVVKGETGLAVTLSLGERPDEELEAWRAAGADRYLLRFETSRRELYERIHPGRGMAVSDRVAMLRRLGEMGYEVGSGVMIGIPGQGYADLARDIELFGELDLDMIGVGPFIAHPGTPLGAAGAAERLREEMGVAAAEQVAGGEEMTYRVVALARLMCPRANIPATTALATLNKASGREKGLSCGANVVMPNVTPVRYRSLYEIYPEKACINETAAQCQGCLRGRLMAIGRSVGVGPGSSANWLKRREEEERTADFRGFS